MFLYLEPLDTLFFRDSRPFDAGTDTFAESTLPSLLAVYGALGSHVLSKSNVDVEKFLKKEFEDPALGWYDETLQNTRLKVKGIFLCWGEEVYLPPPANLLYVTDRADYWAAVPSSEADLEWDVGTEEAGLRPLGLPEGDWKPVETYLSLGDMKKGFLGGGEIISLPEYKLSKFLDPEYRFGHKINRDALVVEEGFLYSAAHLRFNEYLNGKR